MKQKPLVYSAFGLILIVFGAVDYRFLNKTLGIVLIILGVILGISGYVRYRQLR